MDDRLERLQATVGLLAETLSRLEGRVKELERAGGPVTEAPSVSLECPPADASPAGRGAQGGLPLVRVLSAIGMFFLVLAGAFLLRSFTGTGVLGTTSGVVLGLLYSLCWVFAADRAHRQGSSLIASFLGIASVLTAYPLLWEATEKLQATSSLEILSPEISAAIVTGFTVVAMCIAWRRGFLVLAWAVTIATIASCCALLMATTAVEAFAVPLLALGVMTVWLAYRRGWMYQRWPAALAVDVVVLLMVYLAGRAPEHAGRFDHFSTPLVQLLAVGLLVTYLASFVFHSLIPRGGITFFEVLQTAMVVLIGFGGAVRVAGPEGTGGLALGAAALAGAGVCYAVAFTFVDRRLGRGSVFHYYAWLALVLALSGSWQLFSPAILTYFLLLLAVATAYLGGRFDRITLRAHCAVAGALAGWTSGLIGFSFGAFTSATPPDWNESIAIVFTLLVVCHVLLVITLGGRRARWPERIPRLVVLVLWVVAAGALLVTLGSRLLPRGSTDFLAVIRTAVLSGSAIALAVGGRRSHLVEMSWLLYPLLAICGLKLVVEDLRQSGPVALFIAFACYGVALIVAPRLQRKARKPSEQGNLPRSAG